MAALVHPPCGTVDDARLGDSIVLSRTHGRRSRLLAFLVAYWVVLHRLVQILRRANHGVSNICNISSELSMGLLGSLAVLSIIHK